MTVHKYVHLCDLNIAIYYCKHTMTQKNGVDYFVFLVNTQ